MALWTDIKSIIDGSVFDNDDQLITGEALRLVLNQMVDEIGKAHQVFGAVATSFNPGTPQNPVAYITLKGVYTNFNNLEITAALGILKWNGAAWSVTQIDIASIINVNNIVGNVAISGNLTLGGGLTVENDVDINASLEVDFLHVNGNTEVAQDLIVTQRAFITGATHIATHTPASAGAAGTVGHIAWDADYIYVCTQTDRWVRVLMEDSF